MKAWITKYALSGGIWEVNGEQCADTKTMFRYGGNYVHGNDWHTTKESALKRAEEMRAAKIASLQKQIAKLTELRFK